MLPGMSAPAGFMSTANDPFWSSASAEVTFATGLTITKPSGVVSGDLLIAIVLGGNGTWTGDTGWTEAIDQGATPGIRVAYKVAGGSEGASYTFTGSASGVKFGIILCYRGVSWDVIGASVTTLTGDGTLAISGVTSGAGTDDGVLLAVVATIEAVTSTHSVPSGMRLIASHRESVSNRLLSIFAQTISGGATGTRSSTIGGGTTGDNGGILIGLKP